MSALHSPLKCFSFLILLLTPILELSSSATPGSCEERCEIDRPYWSTKPYTLDCKEEYENEQELNDCKSNCKNCVPEICSQYNSDIYKCPAKFGPSPPISEDCKKRCDGSRPVETTGPYMLSCKAEFDTQDKIDECRKDSKLCPRTVSTPYDPDIFNCPSGKKREALTGRCKKRCDNKRKPGTTASYVLDCEKDYEFEDDADDCRNECYSDCPSWVCDYRNANIFNCPKIPKPLPPPPPPPPNVYEGYCKKQCDKERPSGPYGPKSEPYDFRCSDKYNGYSKESDRKLCKRDCKRCPSENCDSKRDDNSYRCKSYQLEKRCEDVCNANRKYGTTAAYTLKCSTAYSTKWEIQYCTDTCFDCKNEICDETLDNNTYNCPLYIVPIVEKPDPYPGNKWESGRERGPGGDGLSTYATAFFVIFFLLLIGCIGACIFSCVRKRHTVQQTGGQYYAGPGGAGPAGGYPAAGQQPYQMNNYAQGYPTGGQQPYPMSVNQYAPPQPYGSSVPVPRSVPTSQLPT